MERTEPRRGGHKRRGQRGRANIVPSKASRKRGHRSEILTQRPISELPMRGTPGNTELTMDLPRQSESGSPNATLNWRWTGIGSGATGKSRLKSAGKIRAENHGQYRPIIPAQKCFAVSPVQSGTLDGSAWNKCPEKFGFHSVADNEGVGDQAGLPLSDTLSEFLPC